MLPAGEVTCAVKVTVCPGVEGFELEDKVVVVLFLGSAVSEKRPAA
jgi:hypothetical protein